VLNQVIIVGRLVSDPELRKTENGTEVTNITLACPRSYKNADGEYDTDFIDCTLWRGVATNTTEYCRKGDIIGVKGRVETKINEVDGEKKKSVSIVADKVTFLSSAKVKDETEKDSDDLDM
jgi:single-strand DNA-binding protein